MFCAWCYRVSSRVPAGPRQHLTATAGPTAYPELLASLHCLFPFFPLLLACSASLLRVLPPYCSSTLPSCLCVLIPLLLPSLLFLCLPFLRPCMSLRPLLRLFAYPNPTSPLVCLSHPQLGAGPAHGLSTSAAVPPMHPAL